MTLRPLPLGVAAVLGLWLGVHGAGAEEGAPARVEVGMVLPYAPSVAPGRVAPVAGDPLRIAAERRLQGDLRGAAWVLEQALARPGIEPQLKAAAWLALGRNREELGERRGALDAYLKARTDGAVAPWATFHAARTAQAVGDHAQAVKLCGVYRSAWPEGPHADECLVVQGDAFSAMGERSAAQSAYDAWLERHPDSPRKEPLQLAKVLAASRTDPKGSIPALQELAVDHEYHSTGVAARARLDELARQGLDAKLPETTTWQCRLAVEERKCGFEPQAWARFQSLALAAARDPKLQAWVDSQEERFAWGTKQYALLAADFAEEYRRAPAADLAWDRYKALSRGGFWSAAADQLREGARNHPTASNFRNVNEPLGRALLLAGRYPEARDVWTEVGRSGGGLGREARWLAAYAAFRAGELDDAMTRLDAVIADGGEEALAARYYRARTLARQGKRSEAEVERRKILTEAPLSWYGVLLNSPALVDAAPSPATPSKAPTPQGVLAQVKAAAATNGAATATNGAAAATNGAATPSPTAATAPSTATTTPSTAATATDGSAPSAPGAATAAGHDTHVAVLPPNWVRRDGRWPGPPAPEPPDLTKVGTGPVPAAAPLVHRPVRGPDEHPNTTRWAALAWAEPAAPAPATTAQAANVPTAPVPTAPAAATPGTAPAPTGAPQAATTAPSSPTSPPPAGAAPAWERRPDSYLPGFNFDPAVGEATLRRLGTRWGTALPWAQAAADLARVGLYDEAAPIVALMYDAIDAAKDGKVETTWAVRAGTTRDTLRAVDLSDDDWRQVFYYAHDDHHATRFSWGQVRKAPSAEARRLAERRIFPTANVDALFRYGQAWDIDPFLALGLMRQESVYRQWALSPVGAIGLMQVMPRTGSRVASLMGDTSYSPELLEDPASNIRYGTWYLGRLLDRFDGVFPFAVASYNGGPHNVSSWLRPWGPEIRLDDYVEQIPYPETRNYVKKVTGFYATYLNLYAEPGTRVEVPAWPRRDDPTVIDF